MKNASIVSTQEATARGRQVIADLNKVLADKNLPSVKKYNDREAAALAQYDTAAYPKVSKNGETGQMISSIRGSRATRGLFFTKKETIIAGL